MDAQKVVQNTFNKKYLKFMYKYSPVIVFKIKVENTIGPTTKVFQIL